MLLRAVARAQIVNPDEKSVQEIFLPYDLTYLNFYSKIKEK